MKHYKYSKTPQFRNLIQDVRFRHDYKGRDENEDPIYENTSPYPTLNFEGSVKLHGTNGSVVFYKNGDKQYQSRENILTLSDDNSSFMREMSGKNLDFISQSFEFENEVVVYGEWCGKGIMRGTAINGLDSKIFVIFQVKVDGENFTDFGNIKDHKQGIYNIYDFPIYNVEIDFNEPNGAVDIVNKWIQEIEKNCPAGEKFGLEGVGEGIVFRCVENPEYLFKSKGEKHSISKTKAPVEIDPVKVESINEFVEYSVTENRLNQGLEHFSLEMKNLGGYIKWVGDDILSEESDVLNKSGLTFKDVSKSISNKVRTFFLDKFNNLIGI